MDWTSFTQRIVIHAPMKAVYTAWRTAASIEQRFIYLC